MPERFVDDGRGLIITDPARWFELRRLSGEPIGVLRFVEALGLVQRWSPATGWEDSPQMLYYVLLPDDGTCVEVTSTAALATIGRLTATTRSG
jgi:hypothetical protein